MNFYNLLCTKLENTKQNKLKTELFRMVPWLYILLKHLQKASNAVTHIYLSNNYKYF